MDTVVDVEGLSKSFPGPSGTTVEAVRELSFTVGAGEIVGLLGPNGAGKTTTMRLLSTLEHPTSGEVRIAGHHLVRDAAAVRTVIGVVPQGGGTRPIATVRDELLLQARLHRLPAGRVGKLLEQFSLTDLAARRTAILSGGQRRRLDLALGLIHSPRVVLLDEPTAALDPPSRNELWHHIRQLRDATGASVVVSTHHLDEADALCDRVLIVDHGTLVAQDTPAALKQRLGHDTLTIATDVPGSEPAAARLRANLQDLPGVTHVHVRDREVHVGCRGAAALVPHAVLAAHEVGVTVTGITTTQPSLDDAFLALTGHPTTQE